jgi:hypothetical protein
VVVKLGKLVPLTAGGAFMGRASVGKATTTLELSGRRPVFKALVSFPFFKFSMTRIVVVAMRVGVIGIII